MVLIYLVVMVLAAVFTGMALRTWYGACSQKSEVRLLAKVGGYIFSVLLIITGITVFVFIGIFLLLAHLATIAWESYYCKGAVWDAAEDLKKKVGSDK